LPNAENQFIEDEIHKNIRISDTTPNSVSPPTWLSNMLFTQDLINITFIFETFPNTKSKEKNVGGMAFCIFII